MNKYFPLFNDIAYLSWEQEEEVLCVVDLLL